MPRKRTLGFCIFFHDDHYHIPWGKMDQSPVGDGYLGLGNRVEHISFRKKKKILLGEVSEVRWAGDGPGDVREI